MRASAPALLLLLAAIPAASQDLGEPVRFAAADKPRFTVAALSAAEVVVFESGPSIPLLTEWDTLLIQGESPDSGVRFQVSRQDAAGAWSPWQDLLLERRSDGRFWGKARLPRGKGALKLRALGRGVSRGHEVSLYSLEAYLDAPAAPPAPAPSPAPETTGDPDSPRPGVHGRAEWGAAPPAAPYTPDPSPWRITLHHTDGRHTTTLAESLEEARFIQDFHMRGRGWNDIAYHFLIDAEGNVIEGRPEGVQGAHTLANNEGNVGVVFLGDYHPPTNDAPTPAQTTALVALGRYLVARYAIDPAALKGHRDYKKTDCPGDGLYARLDELRKDFGRAPAPSPAPGRKDTLPPPWRLLPPLWDERPAQR